MGIIRQLFGGREGPPSPPPDPPRDVQTLIQSVTRPGALLRAAGGSTPSYFGGPPPLPHSMPWPHKDDKPLTFLACLHLPSLAEPGIIGWLPPTGNLLLFYDMERQPWGYDPKDRGSWAVLHVAECEVAGEAPDGPVLCPRRHLDLQPLSIPPSGQHPAFARLDLSHAEEDAIEEHAQALLGDEPVHQVGGHPRPVQGDNMEMECQLASHGVWCGEPTAFETPRAKVLANGASEWRLLLQLDSDETLDVMWGDCGTIYFWIREQDARNGDFERAWLILQCC